MKNLTVPAMFLLFFHASEAQAKMRFGVNLLGYSSGELEADNADLEYDTGAWSLGYTPGISLGFRFADQFEAGGSLASKSEELEDFEQSETAFGVYSTYYLPNPSEDLTWLVGVSAGSGNAEEGDLDIETTTLSVYAGAEMEINETASLSAKLSYASINMEVDTLDLEGHSIGLGIALLIWLQ